MKIKGEGSPAAEPTLAPSRPEADAPDVAATPPSAPPGVFERLAAFAGAKPSGTSARPPRNGSGALDGFFSAQPAKPLAVPSIARRQATGPSPAQALWASATQSHAEEQSAATLRLALAESNRSVRSALAAYGLELKRDLGLVDLKRLDDAWRRVTAWDCNNASDLWATIHTGWAVGERKMLAAVATLAHLGVLPCDRVGIGGVAAAHAIVIGVPFPPHIDKGEDPADAEPLALPFDPKFELKGRYVAMADRVRLLARLGGDLDSSMHALKTRFRQDQLRAGVPFGAVNDMLAWHGLIDGERGWDLPIDVECDDNELSPRDELALVRKTVKRYGSPLMNALLIKDDLPAGRNPTNLSRVESALGLIEHGADLDLPIDRPELAWLGLPVYPLHVAVDRHAHDVVAAFIRKGADVHVRDAYGRTALHWAVMTPGHARSVEALVEKGGHDLVSMADGGGVLPLHRALSQPDGRSVDLLLEASTPDDLLARTLAGETLMHWACKQPGNVEGVRKLLSRGAAAGLALKSEGETPQERGNTALHHVARFARDGDMARELIEAFRETAARRPAGDQQGTPPPSPEEVTRAWIDAPNEAGRRALQFAVDSGDVGLFDVLVGAGAAVFGAGDARGERLLLRAVRSGSPELVERLLDHQSAIATQTWRLAAGSTDPRLLKALLDRGAPPRLGNPSLLEEAVRTPGNAATVGVLLQEAGFAAAVNARTPETLLHQAVKKPGNHETVKLLLAAGARDDVDARTADGETALQLAVRQPDSLETIRALLQAGADANPQIGTRRPLLFMAANHASEPEVVDLLLESGARTHAGTSDGSTLVHFVARATHPAVARRVMRIDGVAALVNQPTRDGFTPLLAAAQATDSADVVNLLVEAGADPRATRHGMDALQLYVLRDDARPDVADALAGSGLDFDRPATPGEDSPYENFGGLNALQIAVARHRDGVAGKLLRRGADPRVLDGEGRNLLHRHLEDHIGDDVSVTELIDFGVDPRQRDNRGNTLLHTAAEGEGLRRAVFQVMLDCGVDVRLRNEAGDSPLDILARSWQPDEEAVGDLLLDHGADIREPSGRNLNVMLEALKGALDAFDNMANPHVFSQKVPLVRRFIEEGVVLDDVLEDGRTALHLVLDHDAEGVAPLLLDKGADLLVCDRQGLTAGDIAAWRLRAGEPEDGVQAGGTQDDEALKAECRSVVDAFEQRKASFSDPGVPVEVKSARLDGFLKSLESAQPLLAVVRRPIGDDDEEADRRSDASQINWRLFGRNIMTALEFHRSISAQRPTTGDETARLRNLIQKMSPEMTLPALASLAATIHAIADPEARRHEADKCIGLLGMRLREGEGTMPGNEVEALIDRLAALRAG